MAGGGVVDLASHVLGQLTRRLRAVWPRKYQAPLSVVETFVDTRRSPPVTPNCHAGGSKMGPRPNHRLTVGTSTPDSMQRVAGFQAATNFFAMALECSLRRWE